MVIQIVFVDLDSWRWKLERLNQMGWERIQENGLSMVIRMILMTLASWRWNVARLDGESESDGGKADSRKWARLLDLRCLSMFLFRNKKLTFSVPRTGGQTKWAGDVFSGVMMSQVKLGFICAWDIEGNNCSQTEILTDDTDAWGERNSDECFGEHWLDDNFQKMFRTERFTMTVGEDDTNELAPTCDGGLKGVSNFSIVFLRSRYFWDMQIVT